MINFYRELYDELGIFQVSLDESYHFVNIKMSKDSFNQMLQTHSQLCLEEDIRKAVPSANFAYKKYKNLINLATR